MRTGKRIELPFRRAGHRIEGAHRARHLIHPLIVVDGGADHHHPARHHGGGGDLHARPPGQPAGIECHRAVPAETFDRLAGFRIQRNQPPVIGAEKNPPVARPVAPIGDTAAIVAVGIMQAGIDPGIERPQLFARAGVEREHRIER